MSDLKKKLNVLIIGYGSIGKRHEEALISLNMINKIDLVSNQIIPNKVSYTCLEEVDNIEDYDYFVIASETVKHFDQLEYLESIVSGKTILCEKPLFENFIDLKIIKNKVFVGYVLRFHPLLQKLKELLVNEKIFNVNINCGQYLPLWRSGVDYRKSYSSRKSKGGGVLLDLSHEIDYAQWLFGELIELKSYQLKVSDLEIDTDDIVIFMGKTSKNIIFNISIDYISKINHRKIMVNTSDFTYDLDLISNNLTVKNKLGEENKIECNPLERNDMFRDMHQSIFSDQNYLCSYEDGINVMKSIQVIQEQNQ